MISKPEEVTPPAVQPLERKPRREVEFRLVQISTTHSWQAFIKDGDMTVWRPLRPAPTTFESAQAAIYDEMIAWAFPR